MIAFDIPAPYVYAAIDVGLVIFTFLVLYAVTPNGWQGPKPDLDDDDGCYEGGPINPGDRSYGMRSNSSDRRPN